MPGHLPEIAPGKQPTSMACLILAAAVFALQFNMQFSEPVNNSQVFCKASV